VCCRKYFEWRRTVHQKGYCQTGVGEPNNSHSLSFDERLIDFPFTNVFWYSHEANEELYLDAIFGDTKVAGRSMGLVKHIASKALRFDSVN
jgi:hypothetical protein